MKINSKEYYPGDKLVEDYLSCLYYKIIGVEEAFAFPVNPWMRKQIDEMHTLFCRKFKEIYGDEFLTLLKKKLKVENDVIEEIEDSLENPQESAELYEFACADNVKPDVSIVRKISSSYEYGIQFLYAFNLKHNIIDETTFESVIAQDTVYVLAACTSSFYEKTRYLWSDRFFSSYQSSLYRIGKDDYRFIIHAKKENFKMKRIKITINNPGRDEILLSSDCLESKDNVVLPHKGEINEKTTITIKIFRIG